MSMYYDSMIAKLIVSARTATRRSGAGAGARRFVRAGMRTTSRSMPRSWRIRASSGASTPASSPRSSRRLRSPTGSIRPGPRRRGSSARAAELRRPSSGARPGQRRPGAGSRRVGATLAGPTRRGPVARCATVRSQRPARSFFGGLVEVAVASSAGSSVARADSRPNASWRRPPVEDGMQVSLAALGRGGDSTRADRSGATCRADAGQAAARLAASSLADAGPARRRGQPGARVKAGEQAGRDRGDEDGEPMPVDEVRALCACAKPCLWRSGTTHDCGLNDGGAEFRTAETARRRPSCASGRFPAATHVTPARRVLLGNARYRRPPRASHPAGHAGGSVRP